MGSISKLQQHLSYKNVIVQYGVDELFKRAERVNKGAVDFAEAGILVPIGEPVKFVYIKESNLLNTDYEK